MWIRGIWNPFGVVVFTYKVSRHREEGITSTKNLSILNISSYNDWKLSWDAKILRPQEIMTLFNPNPPIFKIVISADPPISFYNLILRHLIKKIFIFFCLTPFKKREDNAKGNNRESLIKLYNSIYIHNLYPLHMIQCTETRRCLGHDSILQNYFFASFNLF